MSLDGKPDQPGVDALRVLVVNGDVAARDRDAGSLRLFRIIELLAADGHEITYVARAGFEQERSAAELAALGVEVYPVDRTRLRELGAPVQGPGLDFHELVANGRFDLAWLSFYDVAEQYLPLIRAGSPLTRIVIDTVDVHHVRERRGAELIGDPVALARAAGTEARERAIYRAADALVAVSKEDAAALQALAPEAPVFVVATVHEAVPPTPGFDVRNGLVFVGSFPHAPNVDAVLDFHRTTWPLIKAGLPGARLTLVGTEPPPPVLALRDAEVAVTGWVPETAPYLDAARISIAPLRYGAGVKGKIGEALSRGLPVVTTPIGAEGLDLQNGEHALIADDPAGFAAAVLRLHGDPELWKRISAAGRSHIEGRLGPGAARTAVRSVLSAVARTRFVIAASAPGVEQAIGAYVEAFSAGEHPLLALTVPEGDPAAAQAAFDAAARTLAERGLDPDSVADIEIVPAGSEPLLPWRAVAVAEGNGGRRVSPAAPSAEWRGLAGRTPARSRLRSTPRAAVLVHALDDPAALGKQLEALRRAELPDDVELILAADLAGPGTERLLTGLGAVKVVRGATGLGRRQAWQLGAHATDAPMVVALAPLAIPSPGFVEALIEPLRTGVALVGPVVGGAAGLRVAADGSLWPRHAGAEEAPDALALDCLAAGRDLIADGLPALPYGEGHIEMQLARWATERGGIAVAPHARVERLAPPAATVIVATRNRAEELPDGITLLLASGASDVVIVNNDSTDDTADVAAELAARSNRTVRVVDEPRGGLCHARNAGAAAARHDLLLYIDDDARPAPGWLEHIAWSLARPGVANVGGPIAALWPEVRVTGWPGRELEPLLSVLDLGDVERTLVPPDVVYGANWAVRRDALNAVGGFDPQFGPAPDARINGDEVSVAWRLSRAGAGATVYAPGGAVGHRISPERVNESFMIHRALCVGVERPRHAHALGEAGREGLLASATAAARQLLASVPMEGDVSLSDALERIACTSVPLAHQVQTAIALGELAASVALLGESEVLIGGVRLQIGEHDALLKGTVPEPVSQRA